MVSTPAKTWGIAFLELSPVHIFRTTGASHLGIRASRSVLFAYLNPDLGVLFF